jgi:hypothetical protein
MKNEPVHGHCDFGTQKYDQEIRRKEIKIQRPYNRNTTYTQCKNGHHTRNNRGNWNLPQTIHKVPEQNTGKARYQGTAENSYTGHSTHCGKC